MKKSPAFQRLKRSLEQSLATTELGNAKNAYISVDVHKGQVNLFDFSLRGHSVVVLGILSALGVNIELLADEGPEKARLDYGI